MEHVFFDEGDGSDECADVGVGGLGLVGCGGVVKDSDTHIGVEG